jgi:hypothetical protein
MNQTLRSLLLGGALLLAGCSALQFTYNQADALLAWRVDDYFDFDARQKHEFKQRLERLLTWHRREQLPEYSRFVHTAVERAQGGLRRDDILWFIDGLNQRYRLIVERGTPDAADVLATLSPEQLRATVKEFAKVNKRFIDDHDLEGSMEQQKRARLKRLLGQISDWTGSLTRAQEQQVEAMLESMPLIEPLRHQDRLRRQREFLELLKLRTHRAEFGEKLRQWLLDWDRGRTPEYERLAAEVNDKRIEFYIALEKLLTPAQRERALKRLHGFGNDFKALSERPAAAAAIDWLADKIAAD